MKFHKSTPTEGKDHLQKNPSPEEFPRFRGTVNALVEQTQEETQTFSRVP